MKNIKLILFFIIAFFAFNISAKAITPTLSYQTHVQNLGWQNYVGSNEISGTSGQSLRLEGIKIIVDGLGTDLHINYQTHVQNLGWQEVVTDGNLSGTTGQSLRLEAIKINLTGTEALNYDIYYQVHVQNIGWLGWAKNGEASGSEGYSYRLEAIKIIIVAKDTSAPGSTYRKFISHEVDLNYRTHVQNIGWQNYVDQAEMSGTTGQALRLEAIQAVVDGHGKDLNITYQTHVQNLGWQEVVTNGQVAGTSGQSLRLEAIKINLTGADAVNYDIYYQVHVENIGWLDWAKNGVASGTEGYSYRLEGIRIVIVKKTEDGPGVTTNPFYIKSNFIWSGTGTSKSLYNSISGLIGNNVSKIIDVSEHQGIINWDKVKNEAGIDGVILRAGFGSFYEDGQFAYNISALKRLNIPYGIYIFSYAENDTEAASEATGILNIINYYHLNPTLGVYYDIEDWELSNFNSYSISKETYESMSSIFLTAIRSQGYTAGIYTGVSYSNNRLNDATRLNVSWIAQYNSFLQYTRPKMWQYTSSATIPGISGNVDVNVWFN